MNKELFNILNEEVQIGVKNILKVYDKCTIVYEHGSYTVQTGSYLKNVYAPDFKVVGNIHKNDIYTEEEQIINYIEEFREYPPEYKYKRDYNIIKKLDEYRKNMKQGKLKIEDETLIIYDVVDIVI